METIQTKCCSKCGVEKPATTEYFYKRSDRKHNFHGVCIDCKKKYRDEYYVNNYEKILENNRKYVLTKYDEIIEYQKNYRQENRDVLIEQSREYYKKNSEVLIKKKKEYHKKNKDMISRNKKIYASQPGFREKINEKNRQKYKSDPEFKFNSIIYKHIRTVERRADFKQEWDDVKDIYEMYGIDYHIDHKVPKNWFKSNTPKSIVNDLRNLQVIDAKYNLTKLDRWADQVCDEYKEMILPYIKNGYLVSL